VTALTDAINQNTRGNSQGFPLGVPTSFGWYAGSTQQNSAPPSNFSSVTGWGQVYPESGAPADPNATVQIANFQTYLHLTNGSWVLAQNQATEGIGGAHYLADFSGNASVPWNETKLPDGSVSVDAPQSGYNDHFWQGTRGTYAPGTVDGVFVEASMKTNDANANLVADLGADWWLNPTAPFVTGFANNPAAGSSDWVKLTTSYQTLYYTSLSASQLQADPPPGLTGSTSTTPPVTTPPVTTPPVTTPPAVQPAVTQATASPGSGVEHVGDKITLTVGFNEAVTVAGQPTLTLNDGSTASYVSGSGTNALVFSTTVAATNTATSALAITAVNLASGASIKDASGVSANLSGAAKTFSGLQINPTQPAVTQATASPGTGVEQVGDKITLTLGFNEAVTVAGQPTLTLNDGSAASYVSGSGTNALVFSTTVAATNTATSALAVTGVNLASGASIKDASGLSANLSGAAKTFSGLQINPTPPVTTPPVTTPPATTPAVTQATASPGSGVEQVGDKIALTLGFNEAVTVAGQPTLTLNDGSTASYVSGSGTNALVFSTTVAATNTATSALAVTGVNLASGASIKDASGVSANLSGAAKTFSGLQINPTPPATTPPVTTPPGTGSSGGATPPKSPVLSVADHSLSVSPGHSVSLGIGVTVPNQGDAVTVNVAGLPKYETITDSLDHKTFSGSSISLTAAEVNSGLTLSSHYRGHGDPTATLTVTATDSTGKPVTSAAQTITVKDPPATAGGSWPSSGGHHHHDHDHSFALLSQSMAAGGSQGRADLGQIAMAASHASSWLNQSLLTRPQH
jgi:hypothetical protein